MTTPNTTGPSDEIQRYHHSRAVDDVFASKNGKYVLHSDHLAALSRARDEARREALEEDRRAPSPAVKALVEACRAIKDYERSGAVPFLEWDRYYDAMHEALAAVEREIGGA